MSRGIRFREEEVVFRKDVERKSSMEDQKKEMIRREFLGAAAMSAMTIAAFPAALRAAEWTAQEKANVQIVTDFCAAWSTRDIAKPLAHLADDCVYRMSCSGSSHTRIPLRASGSSSAISVRIVEVAFIAVTISCSLLESAYDTRVARDPPVQETAEPHTSLLP